MYLPCAIVEIMYVINPNAIPNEIEYVKSIMIIVINTDAITAVFSQSISFICTNIKIPTITNSAVVTAGVNNDNTRGA